MNLKTESNRHYRYERIKRNNLRQSANMLKKIRICSKSVIHQEMI